MNTKLPENEGEMSWWEWMLIVIAVWMAWALAVIAILRHHRAKSQERASGPGAQSISLPVKVRPAQAAPDDLQRIEGVGTKIAAALARAGIATFAQVAATSPERLSEALRQQGIRLAFPETWPEQAALAAEGRWDRLEALQEQLKGGRRA